MKLLLNCVAGFARQARQKPVHEKGPGATPAPLSFGREYQ